MIGRWDRRGGAGISRTPAATREIVGGKRTTQIGARFAAIAVGSTARAVNRHTGARLTAIVICAAPVTRAHDTGRRFPAIIVAAAAQQAFWANQRPGRVR